MILGTASGKLGDVVLYRRGGEQGSRVYIRRVNDAATRAQVSQRAKLGNLVANYRALRAVILKGFENKPANQSDYNAFMGANLSASNVYLTAAEVASGAGVVGPYIISKGSLQPIDVVEQPSGTFVTDIAVAPGFAITGTTTISELSEAIVSANFDWQIGDQLSMVAIQQILDANNGIPYLAGRFFEITLDYGNTTLVRDMYPEEYLSVVDGFIGFVNAEFVGAEAYLQSRKTTDGRLLVSPATLKLSDNNTIYATYSGTNAETRAVETRGYNEPVFLDPGTTTSGSAASPRPTTSFTSLARNGSIVVPGNAFGPLPTGTTVRLVGNNLSEASISFRLSNGTTVPLATFLTVTTNTDTMIEGTVTSGTSTLHITQVLFGSTVAANYPYDEWEDPTA